MKLPAEVREDCDSLKAALLERDEANIKNAAATFWTYTKQAGISALEHRQFVQRLVKRFIDGDDKESWEDALVREKTIQDLPKEGRMYVRERKPKTSLDVARLAEEYFANREESYTAWKANPTEQDQQSHHGRRDRYQYNRGRRAGSPRYNRQDTSPRQEETEVDHKTPHSETKGQNNKQGGAKKPSGSGKSRDPKSGKCFRCGEPGHKQADCQLKVNRIEAISPRRLSDSLRPGQIDRSFNNILLDSGEEVSSSERVSCPNSGSRWERLHS